MRIVYTLIVVLVGLATAYLTSCYGSTSWAIGTLLGELALCVLLYFIFGNDVEKVLEDVLDRFSIDTHKLMNRLFIGLAVILICASTIGFLDARSARESNPNHIE